MFKSYFRYSFIKLKPLRKLFDNIIKLIEKNIMDNLKESQVIDIKEKWTKGWTTVWNEIFSPRISITFKSYGLHQHKEEKNKWDIVELNVNIRAAQEIWGMA